MPAFRSASAPTPRPASISTEERRSRGRGLSRLHAAMNRHRPHAQRDAPAPPRRATGGRRDLLPVAELVGLLCRELSLRFMPLEGLFLAGTWAAAIADRMALFEPAFLAESHMRHIPENTPVFLIRDDMAALHGCLAALS